MIRGVRLLETSMSSLLARQEVLARNVGNFLTPGYKQEDTGVNDFSVAVARMEELSRGATVGGVGGTSLGSISSEVFIDRVNVDFRQGDLQQTDRDLDVALVGDGFLQVRTGTGLFFSRGGPLYRDASGRLVTAEGYWVQGLEGDLVLGDGAVSIADDGAISVDGEPAGRLSVLEFEPGTLLAKMGEGLYAPVDPAAAPTDAVSTTVKQGYLEGSNVDRVAVLSEMVWLVRAYQASQRMLVAQDELLGKAVNEVGRL